MRERDLCRFCLKPAVTCYCAELRPFEASFALVLLQHPLERKRSIGTARMTHRCVRNSQLIQGESFAHDPVVNALLDEPANHCVVLYPGARSLDIGALPPEERRAWVPADRRLVVFVIDGTWFCAKKMLGGSPNLQRLPQIRFSPVNESEYVIRKQPRPHCLSTLEAVHRLLRILEPGAEHHDSLLDLFRGMVARQIEFARLNQLRKVEAR
jgi:DTW domain-containing protein YfiP